jgi:hypothetical protein
MSPILTKEHPVRASVTASRENVTHKPATRAEQTLLERFLDLRVSDEESAPSSFLENQDHIQAVDGRE